MSETADAKRPWGVWAVAILLAAAAAWGVARATPFGVGFSRDSTQYARYAEAIIRPRLLTVWRDRPDFLAHYPPLYPLTLVPARLLGYDIRASARAVVLVCVVLECLLVAAAVRTGKRGRAGLVRTGLAIALYCGCPAVLGVHLWACSEVPFLVFVVAGVWLSLRYLNEPTRQSAAWAGAAVAGICLTRYSGLFVFAGLVPIVFLAAQGWKTRITHTAIFSAVALLPIGMVMVWQKLAAETMGNRHIEYHALTADHLSDLIETFSYWFASPQLFPRVALVGGLVLGLILGGVLLSVGPRRLSGPARIALSVTIVYTALLLFSVAFIDTATPLDFRLFCPVAAVMILWAACDMPGWPGTWRVREVAAVAAAWIVVASVGLADVTHARVDVGESMEFGKGLAHAVWRTSKLMERAAALPEGATIYSNYPDALYVHAGRVAAILPTRPTRIGREDAIPLTDRMAETAKHLAENNGYIVYFRRKGGKSVAQMPVSRRELAAAMHLTVETTTKDGWIFRNDWNPLTQKTLQAEALEAQLAEADRRAVSRRRALVREIEGPVTALEAGLKTGVRMPRR